MFLRIQVHPLVDSRVEEVSFGDQSLTLLVEEGLWVQVNNLHCFYSKAMSLMHFDFVLCIVQVLKHKSIFF